MKICLLLTQNLNWPGSPRFIKLEHVISSRFDSFVMTPDGVFYFLTTILPPIQQGTKGHFIPKTAAKPQKSATFANFWIEIGQNLQNFGQNPPFLAFLPFWRFLCFFEILFFCFFIFSNKNFLKFFRKFEFFIKIYFLTFIYQPTKRLNHSKTTESVALRGLHKKGRFT